MFLLVLLFAFLCERQIGPLVVGACVLSPEQEVFLRNAGIRDSKELSPNQRDKFLDLIQGRLTC